MKAIRTALTIGALFGGAAIGIMLSSRQARNRYTFRDRCVVITGGSRGLGLVLARQLARRGSKLGIMGRSQVALQGAEAELSALGAEVLALRCDVRRQEEVEAAIKKVMVRFGAVDVLINNAGIIQVAPLEHMTVKDFEDALATHLLGPLHCILAVLPHMRRAGQGRIVNISSIGGKIAIPHLLPYCASKFALVGLSDGLRAELRRHHILVTTVCPGLMRTGSPRNASFKGQHRREYAWFAVSDSLPWVSMDAEQAAEEIISACRRGASRVVLGLHMKGAVLLNELFPGAMSTLLSAANRVLPGPALEAATEAHPGSESNSPLAPSWLTRLTDRAALRNNELAA
jgi:NAD(P)-dependent dehydrogenase (short-subunit alcohol dehydrogenase family)